MCQALRKNGGIFVNCLNKFKFTNFVCFPGLKITTGQRTMSGLIEALTGQTLDLAVMLTGQN